jgi:putative aldouronate transport system substrate-binding protein
MRKTRLISLLLAIFMLASLLASCGTTAPAASSSAPAASSAAASTSASTDASAPATAALEPYTFTHYFNYDWWGLKPWGVDGVSKYLQEKFNITVEFQKPDADPAAKLNVMISAGDLPDSMMMDRGVDLRKLAELGLLVDMEPLMNVNPNLRDNVAELTREQLKIDGKLYSIPNWSRIGPTGGNDAWVYNQRLYEAAGSPALNTFEDLYNYAKKIKTDVPKNNEGLTTYPMMFDFANDAHPLARSFFRSFGGVLNGWYTVLNGNYTLAFRDPVFKAATMEGNKWWREGLLSETQFTDTGDQILEKIVAGRTALMYYDQSKNESNKFRTILKESFPDDSYEMVSPYPYPPANGLTKDQIYADYKESLGWNVTVITTSAKEPQRIYDLWSYLLTQEACIIQMYGPQGMNWDTLNEQGLPILKKAESELKPEEVDALGAWFWMIPGQSDHVDMTKFAVNGMQPPEKQNWVINNQANVLTPIMFMTDEFIGIADSVDPKSDEGIARALCEDFIKAEYPKVIMAGTAEEAEKDLIRASSTSATRMACRLWKRSTTRSTRPMCPSLVPHSSVDHSPTESTQQNGKGCLRMEAAFSSWIGSLKLHLEA